MGRRSARAPWPVPQRLGPCFPQSSSQSTHPGWKQLSSSLTALERGSAHIFENLTESSEHGSLQRVRSHSDTSHGHRLCTPCSRSPTLLLPKHRKVQTKVCRPVREPGSGTCGCRQQDGKAAPKWNTSQHYPHRMPCFDLLQPPTQSPAPEQTSADPGAAPTCGSG